MADQPHRQFWADLHERLKDPLFRAYFVRFAQEIAEKDAQRNAAAEVACPATFEDVPPNRRDTTHSCDREPGHDGRHHCPLCHTDWSDTARSGAET